MVDKKFIILFIVLIIIGGTLFFPVFGKKRKSGLYTSPDKHSDFRLPETFLWGTATAAQQMESSPESDWTAFEQKAFSEKKFEYKGMGEPKPGHIHNFGNYSAEIRDKKTDHMNRFADDFALAKDMGNNSYRFSISWDKLFPRENMKLPDPSAIQYYKKMIAEIKKNNLIPSGTLFHFSTPNWFWKEKNGKRGWEKESAVEEFEIFVRAVMENFGKDITHWCTLNEPMVYIYSGYMQGLFPPLESRKDIRDVIPAVENLLKAHASAYIIIKGFDKINNVKSEVGLTMHTRAFEPYRNYAILDRIVAGVVEQAFIWDFTDAVQTGVLKVTNTDYKKEIPGLKGTMDYLGINYYGRFYVKTNIFSPTAFQVMMNDPLDKQEKKNELGWGYYPLGLTSILEEGSKRYSLPIYILENGTADSKDEDFDRQQILAAHIREISIAVKNKKADVRGYFHWSLIDNFEWAEGFEAKFGLYKVDYQDQFRRSPRKSAELYKKIIQNRGLAENDFQRYIK